MAKHDSDMDGPDSAPDSPPGERQRVRLHPRQGSEHRFRFARRWENRRRSRGTGRIWLMLGLDAGIIVVIYLLTRMLLRKLGL